MLRLRLRRGYVEAWARADWGKRKKNAGPPDTIRRDLHKSGKARRYMESEGAIYLAPTRSEAKSRQDAGATTASERREERSASEGGRYNGVGEGAAVLRPYKREAHT